MSESNKPAPSGEIRGTRIDELRKLPVDRSTRGTDEERAAHNLKTLADWKPLAPEATTKEPPLEHLFLGRFDDDWTPKKEAELLKRAAAKTSDEKHDLTALTDVVAPGEAVGREKRELQRNDVVGQVLQEFGFKSAAALRTVIVDMRMAESTLRRERDQLKSDYSVLELNHISVLDKKLKLESQVRELSERLKKVTSVTSSETTR